MKKLFAALLVVALIVVLAARTFTSPSDPIPFEALPTAVKRELISLKDSLVVNVSFAYYNKAQRCKKKIIAHNYFFWSYLSIERCDGTTHNIIGSDSALRFFIEHQGVIYSPYRGWGFGFNDETKFREVVDLRRSRFQVFEVY